MATAEIERFTKAATFFQPIPGREGDGDSAIHLQTLIPVDFQPVPGRESDGDQAGQGYKVANPHSFNPSLDGRAMATPAAQILMRLAL